MAGEHARWSRYNQRVQHTHSVNPVSDLELLVSAGLAQVRQALTTAEAAPTARSA